MNIQKNIPLAGYTTFKTGGSADYFCEIRTKEDLVECFDWIKKDKLPYFCLGNGSNLLINDQGFRGVVLKMVNDHIEWDGKRCVAGAGITLANLINEAKKRNLGGLERCFGIPASLGGGIRNNAGAYGSELATYLESVEIFDIKTGKFETVSKDKFGFSYHKSIFLTKPDWIVWQATLVWEDRDIDGINAEIKKFLNFRSERQPLEKPSAGSFFRNPSLTTLNKTKRDELVELYTKKELSKEKDEENKNRRKKEVEDFVTKTETLPAGFFIEQTGLKGREVGGAQVSTKHANFLVNKGNAKTEDVIILASMVKQKVRAKFGVQLFEEVEYVGF